MASQEDIEAFYDGLGYFHVLRMGKYKDYTCAFFNGDFNQTLDQAQEAKHDWALKGIGFLPGHRILDIGCGWGPMLQAVKYRGGTALGLTLSRYQESYCKQHGLDARLQDYKQADPAALGQFDGIVCIGAFEHFCSPEEYLAGKQSQLYKDFFRFCGALLRPKGRLYVQSGLFGKRVPDPASLRADAPKDSEERVCFRLSKIYPRAWLPVNKQQVTACASDHFNFLASNNGRADYIETLNRWGDATKSLFRPPNLWPAFSKAISMIPRYLVEPDFRLQVSCVVHNDQQECFKREIMTHERMFFEKK